MSDCFCCRCCKTKIYSFDKPSKPDVVTVQPVSSNKFSENDGPVRPNRRPVITTIQNSGVINGSPAKATTQESGAPQPEIQSPPKVEKPKIQIHPVSESNKPEFDKPGSQHLPINVPVDHHTHEVPTEHEPIIHYPDEDDTETHNLPQDESEGNGPDIQELPNTPVAAEPGIQIPPSCDLVNAEDTEDIPPPLPMTPPPSRVPRPSWVDKIDSAESSEPFVTVIIPSKAPGGAKTDVLTVREVDMCLTLNGSEHHTERYELMSRKVNPQLVVRRGQPFQLDLVLSRAYDPATDAISFVFTLAESEKPSYGHGTLIAVPLLSKGAQNGEAWSAVLQRSSENVISVNITPPAHCIVGVWKMDVDTKLKDDGALSYSHRSKIYILFNAWCKKDQVYMKEDDKRREFVETDTGLIWRGSYNRMRPCIWNYAQFEKDILDCSLYLMTKTGRVPLPSCSDPAKVTRALSAAVNSPDDNGAIMGNWTAEFDGGTPPTKWVGSLMILQRFYNNKKPVKYGQCWVFAGVLTTVCRALGIPARTITTYASAHDTQNSLTVDYFVDDKGEVMEELTSDSIWNFHVWNEVWMKRPDLEPGDYDGWNVIDATPQEMSDDVFRCGPTSVKAVKRGEVLKPYDSAFVYAEVNADKVFWKYTGPTQPLKLLRKDTLGIGQFVSTKAVGKWTREDITDTYKFPEKSEDERTAMLKALKQSESLFSRYYLNEEFNDVKFDFKLRDDIVIGSPFSAVVVLSNRSKTKDYTVTVILRIDTVLYTGKVQDSVKKEKFDVVVKAKSQEEVKVDVSYDEYYNKLVDQCAFNIACLATVQDTNYEYFAQDDFRVRKPDIKFKIEGSPAEGQEFSATASVMNPLPVPLKRCRFVIEGPSLEVPIKFKLEHDIEPNSEAKVKFNAKPKFPGKTTIAAKFYSNELVDVDGFIVFMVGDKTPGETNGLSNNIST